MLWEAGGKNVGVVYVVCKEAISSNWRGLLRKVLKVRNQTELWVCLYVYSW